METREETVTIHTDVAPGWVRRLGDFLELEAGNHPDSGVRDEARWLLENGPTRPTRPIRLD